MIVMASKICDMDCFNCIFDDCKYDGSQTAKEGLVLRNAGCPTDKELKAKEPKGKTKTKPYTEKQKEYKRQYAIKNKERIKEYKKKYYEEHKDEFMRRSEQEYERRKAAPGRQSQ